MVKRTDQKPQNCYKCGSNDIELCYPVYKKDKNGKETDIPYLGTWMCSNGHVIGRMMGEGYNELYTDGV